MTQVGCWLTECIYNENGWCNRSIISIGEDLECEDFQDFRSTYTDSFWQACVKDGKKFRRLCKQGKKIEYNGYIFYTDDKITDEGEYFLTEARTGIGVCYYNQLEQIFDKFVSMVGNFPDVTDLPIEERSENGTN